MRGAPGGRNIAANAFLSRLRALGSQLCALCVTFCPLP